MFALLKSYLDNRGPYPAKIRARHQQFWNDPNAENVRNTMLDAEHPLETWKNVINWQRRLSNKHNSREFAGKFGCKLPGLFWQGRDVDKINFGALPKNYVIRPTIGHSAKNIFLMKDGYNLFDKKHYEPSEILSIMKQEVQLNKHLHFLIEEFLRTEKGDTEILKDYKIFCFNGQIACIWVIDRLSPNTGTSRFYDEGWNPIKPVNTKYKQGLKQAPPACLDQMLAQAKTLSRAYEIFVRIDFYATMNGAVFGEFTPTPGMGGNTTRFGQKLLMHYWDKHCNGLV